MPGFDAFLPTFQFKVDKGDFPEIKGKYNHKLEFLVAQAQLLVHEIERVKPVFINYKKTAWDLHKQNHEFINRH